MNILSRALVLLAILTGIIPDAQAEEPVTNLLVAFFPVPPYVFNVALAGSDAVDGFTDMSGVNTNDSDTILRDFFEKAGVTFPAGSSLSYDASRYRLMICNTLENIRLLDRMICGGPEIPNQIEIEVVLLSLPPALAQQFSPGQHIDANDLRPNGTNQVRIVHNISVLTRSGVNAEARHTRPTTGTNDSPAIVSLLSVSPNLAPDGRTMDITTIWEYNPPYDEEGSGEGITVTTAVVITAGSSLVLHKGPSPSDVAVISAHMVSPEGKTATGFSERAIWDE